MENEKEKDPQHDRMAQGVNNTSRTIKSGEKHAGTSDSDTPKGQGRRWHGDSEGHAKAGSQSHKKSGDKKA